MTNAPDRCPECGAPLPEDRPGGQCPRCLMGLGLEKGEAESADTEWETGGDGRVPAGSDRFPGYRVTGRIGEGGCGEVFRAWQDHPVRREVAIKAIKPGMDSRLVLARFDSERQALALMNHENIARVFDAGEGSDGRPFFVMELIEGEDIVGYCDRRQLTVAGRLDLFLRVCEGVRHAHQRGIIHRDLKPSNILVAESDGQPVPKIIDFGIAKALERGRLGGQTIHTVFDQFVGTPVYMSPEQAGFSGDVADTRSDVYSLGVLLYELLAGRPPFAPDRLRAAAVDEIVRIIREEEPPAPSVGLARSGLESLSATARLRLSNARRLVAELRGDLDGIVMKAIEKSPDHRYDSAQELAEDIRRHLRNEPVAARPPGLLRRLRKFARRNKVAATSGLVVFLSLVAGLGVSLWMAGREKQARREMEKRAYHADMNLAARMSQQEDSGYGSMIPLLEAWKKHRPDLCGWEWHFLDSLCHQETTVIATGAQEVESVCWNPRGDLLAAAGTDGQATIWEADTSRVVASWTAPPPRKAFRCMAWSPPGDCLALAGDGGRIFLWNPQTNGPRSLPGHDGNTYAVAWSPDGKMLASGGSDRLVRIWDTASGTESRRLPAGDQVYTVCWSPSGKQLFAFGEHFGTAWETTDFHPAWHPDRVATGVIASSACAPDGSTLAVGEDDGAIHLRDPATGLRLDSFWDNLDIGLSVTWSPDGHTLAASSRGSGRIVVRDWRNGGRKIRELPGHVGSVHSLAWNHDNTRLASGGADGTVRIWDLSGQGRTVIRNRLFPCTSLFLRWAPDGRKLASGGFRTEAWFIDFDLDGAPVVLENAFQYRTRGGDWSPDGKRLVSCGTNGVRLWDTEMRRLVWDRKDLGEGIAAVSWRPGGRAIAASHFRGTLALLDPSDGHTVHSIQLPDHYHRALVWSPDGTLLAHASGKDVRLYDDQLRPVRTIGPHVDEVMSLDWSPDGGRLVTGSREGMVRIWNAADGRLIRSLAGHGASVAGVDWSPDGTRIVSGAWDRSIRIWDPETGSEILALPKPGGAVEKITAVAWHPDGKRIAATDLEGSTILLDAEPAHGTPPSPSVTAAARSENVRFLRAWCEVVESHADNDADALRRLAWLRATSPYREIRDGEKAVRQAAEASRLVGGTNAGILGILAAAHAECGDFAKAVEIQKKALDLTTGTENRTDRMAVLRLYQKGLPYRDGEEN